MADAQEQKATSPEEIHIDGRTPPGTIPEGALSGTPVDQLQQRSNRQTPEPGRNDEEPANTTTLIIGEGGRTQTIVRENQSGESGLTIGGEKLTDAERARSIAADNLEKGNVQGPLAQPSNINTTVHVDSVTVTRDASKNGGRRNNACVRIGVVGDSAECGTD